MLTLFLLLFLGQAAPFFQSTLNSFLFFQEIIFLIFIEMYYKKKGLTYYLNYYSIFHDY